MIIWWPVSCMSTFLSRVCRHHWLEFMTTYTNRISAKKSLIFFSCSKLWYCDRFSRAYYGNRVSVVIHGPLVSFCLQAIPIPLGIQIIHPCVLVGLVFGRGLWRHYLDYSLYVSRNLKSSKFRSNSHIWLQSINPLS